jgi:hypothetical protein
MTEVEAFLTNCRLADGRLIDIGISDGKIAGGRRRRSLAVEQRTGAGRRR